MDHLVFGVGDLAQGIALVERQTGVRARVGGKHPGRGTHNALLSLGGRQYLEIIALDPEQTNASGSMFAALEKLTEPRFIAWAIAVDDIDDIARRARAANYELVGPQDASRAQPDGRLLKWRALRLGIPDLEGVPFFIEWHKASVHPSQDSPAGCRLVSFAIEHTDPDRMGRVLETLGAEAAVTRGPRVRLRARLQTPKGHVELG